MENFNLKEFLRWMLNRISGKTIIVIFAVIVGAVLLSKIIPLFLLIIGIVVIALLLVGKDVNIKQLIEKIKEFKNKIKEQ